MKMSGAEIVARVLQSEGIRFLFGIPGTHNIELYDRLIDEPGLQPILITDEQSAAFLADGVSRASGQMAAANLVPGAGLTHAMSGIAECFLDQVPVLVLSCGIRADTGKAYQLHDVDQASIARPVSKAVFQPATHQQLFEQLREACRIAKEPPAGPAMVEVPADLYMIPGNVTEVSGTQSPVQVPDVRPAADTLNRARAVLMYVGLGAIGAADRLVELAERLDATVFTTISGKGVFPENHPRWAWNTIGRAAPPAIRKLAENYDCLLAIGCRFGEVATGSYGYQPPASLVHVDADATVFHRNYPATSAVRAQAASFVNAILEPGILRERSTDTVQLGKLAEAHLDIRKGQRQPGGDRVHPAVLLDRIHHICGPDTAYVTDSGNGTFLAMEILRLEKPRSFLAPVDYSCMGYSIPAAIGAKLACPDRPVVALVGDGAFLMTGLELATAAAQKCGVLAFLLRDRELSQIAQFQKASMNRQTCTELSDYNAEAIARATGVEFLALEKTAEVESVVTLASQISRRGRPVLVDVAIDYSRPTYFSKGVVMTNFLRFSWKDRLRLVTRVLQRKLVP